MPSLLEVPKTNNSTPIPGESVVSLGNVETEKTIVPTESKVKSNELGGKSEVSKPTETVPVSDNTAKPAENKKDNEKSDNGPARVINAFSYYDNMHSKFPFDSQYFDLGNNISAAVNYIPRLIVMNQDNAVDLENYSYECPESITKPPVFETHICRMDYNRSILGSLLKRRPGHAFLGIRYTYAKMVKGRPVSFSRRRLTLGFNGKLKIGAPSLITDDRIEDAQISTQTPITAEKTVKLFKSMQSYFSTYTRYGLILRNCNKFVKTMAEEIDLHSLASAHDKVMPISTAKILSKNIAKDPDTAFLDYNLGKTSTFINYGRLFDISDDYKESDKITNNRFEEDEEDEKGKKSESEEEKEKERIEREEKIEEKRRKLVNRIKRSRRYRYNYLSLGGIFSGDFKENSERAARKDLSLIDKMTFRRKYRVDGLDSKIEEISKKIEGSSIVLGMPKTDVYKLYKCGAFFKGKFLNDMLDIIGLLKDAIKTAGKEHVNLNIYLLTVINAIIMQYNTQCDSEKVPIETVKIVFDIDDYSGSANDAIKML